MAREIPLSQGLVAIVDDGDFERLSAHKWSAKPADGGASQRWYAYRSHGRSTVYMHRHVVGAPKGVAVDHIDGDGLNNQRANLRLATTGQNNTNRKYESVSGYRGVHLAHGCYRATLVAEGVVLRVTGRLTAEQAARAYDALAREFQGEFAVLNFPNQGKAA